MKRRLLDSNALTAFLGGRDPTTRHVREYLDVMPCLTMSVMNYFEVLRGLYHLGAKRKTERFQELALSSELLPIDGDVAEIAAHLYAGLRQRGQPLPDADILIAATALANDCVLVTGNEKHFRPVKGLEVENWLS